MWDYPRPPRLENFSGHIRVFFNDAEVAETRNSKRVLETSHPPVYYIPRDDIHMQYLIKIPEVSYCEWKGVAHYYTLDVGGKRAEKAAWYYPLPVAAFSAIKNHVAFYPRLMDDCYVDGEKVAAVPGGFYGGWITKNIIGPFT